MQKQSFLKKIIFDTFNVELSPSSYAIDHRLVEPGTLFFALPGSKTHGSCYIAQAAENGAIAAVVDEACVVENSPIPLLKTPSAEKFLKFLAKSLVTHFSPRIVAVTGSVGKTSTKDFVAAILSSSYKVMSSPGNANSQLGLPQAILNHFDGAADVLVLEMGMTSTGDIMKLVELAPPEVALLTAIDYVHACNFNSLEEIAAAKCEIFSQKDTKLKLVHRSAHNRIPRKIIQKNDFKLYGGDAFVASLKLQVHFPADHFYENLQGAIAVAEYFQIDPDKIMEALQSLTTSKRRMEKFMIGEVIFFDDAYNACESSVVSALKGIDSNYSGHRKIAVLGPMLELGKYTYDSHRRVGEKAFQICEMLFCFGEEWRELAENWSQNGFPCVWRLSRQDLGKELSGYLQPRDVVLLKGSRSTHTKEIINELN